MTSEKATAMNNFGIAIIRNSSIMNFMTSKVKRLVENKDYKGLSQLLADHPDLANEGITIPYDFKCSIKAHSLHADRE